MTKVTRALSVLLSIGGSMFFFAHNVYAATLFFSPASGSYAVGKTFTVNVLVSSSDQAANAYSSTVSFPSDLLEMTGIGKGGSIVNLWSQEPSYSAGRANFEGVTFNGYKGGGGKIISLTFKAKAEGVAVLNLVGGSVLANDGEGTNILKGRGSATFTIGKGEEPIKPVVPKVTPPEPEKPVVPTVPVPVPVPVSIPESPRITEYPARAYIGDTLVLKGTTYPASLVTVWLQRDQEQAYSQKLMSDPQGRFTFVSDEKLAKGTYRIWATVTDSLGISSVPSEKITLTVKSEPIDVLDWAKQFLIDHFYKLIILFLLLLLACILWKYYLLTRRLRRGVYGAQEALHRAFDLLKEDIQDQIKILEKARTKRQLTDEEGRILKRLKSDLKVAEKSIRKEINDIERHI